MNYDSYLAHAIEIFNDRMDAGFSGDDIILTCFMTEDQKEIFEQFCSKYFPYRLNDRYQEEGYFDFRASSFIGMDNGGTDGILLRKLAVSEILTAIMTSSEIEASQTWEEAETAIQSLNLFDTPPEMDLFRLVYAQLRTTFLEVDVGFIHELGYLYLNVLSMAVIRNLRQH